MLVNECSFHWANSCIEKLGKNHRKCHWVYVHSAIQCTNNMQCMLHSTTEHKIQKISSHLEWEWARASQYQMECFWIVLIICGYVCTGLFGVSSYFKIRIKRCRVLNSNGNSKSNSNSNKQNKKKKQEKKSHIEILWEKHVHTQKAKMMLYLDPEVCTLEIVALAMFELDPTQYSSLSTMATTT